MTLVGPLKLFCQYQFQVELDELRYAKSRLNAYKGLASESYISLSSDDPILTSFQLAKELRLVASKEKHYRVGRHAYTCVVL